MEDARKRLWGRVVCLVVTVAAVYMVFHRLNLAELARTLRTTNWAWFAAAIVVYGLLFIPATWRWHLVLKAGGLSVHPGATGRLTLIGHFFYNLLFGAIGGDTAKSALYCRWFQYPLPEVLAAAPLDRLLGFAGLVIFSLFALGFGFAGGAFKSIGSISLRWTGISALLVIPIVLAAALLIPRNRWRISAARFMQALAKGAGLLMKSPRVAITGVTCGLLVQIALSAVIALNLRAVSHGSLPWNKLLWTFPLITILSALPITFVGLGVREGSAMVLFGLYHISNTDAVSAALLTLCTSLGWAAMGGILLWRETNRMRRTTLAKLNISVVIPTLNESAALPETVSRARLVAEVREIIVVDGGSTDGTRELAEKLGCRVFTAGGGRGGQMRAGSQRATGDVIVLLHADTWLAEDAGKAILNSLRDSSVVGGGFWKTFRERNLLLAGSRIKCAIRIYIGRRVMGDQAIYIRRETLEKIGGVPEMPLMEEFELCHRMRQVGRLALADSVVTTSARRFARLGIARTYLRMWRVTLSYWMGAGPQKLRRIYEKD
jgi:rSAM/selenodomain-associated transferase 2